MKRARDGLRKKMPAALRRNLDRAAKRLGPYGVRVARTLVARDTGRTAGAITYDAEVKRDGKGWRYELVVYVDAKTRAEALPVFVTEFGRGHGRAGARARGTLPPRPYLRPSRVLVHRRARGAFSRAMRQAAREALA